MFIQFAARLTAYFVLASALSLVSTAQSAAESNPAPGQNSSTQNSSAPDSSGQSPASGQPAAQAPAEDKNKNNKETSPDKNPGKSASGGSGKGKVAGTSNDRLGGVLPNFLSLESTDKLPPLSAKDKFKVVALGTFDPVQYPWWGLLSAINQADNSEPAYGQGWVGYAKRYGTTAADSTIENFMVGAVFPSILHQDPRFYESSNGGFGRRAWYAATRILVTRGDSGKTQFNFSEVFGSAFSAALSTYSYHPRSTYLSTPTNPHEFIGSDRTLLNTANVWGTQVGLDTITIVIKEFWPDLHRAFSHKHKADAGTTKP